MVCDVAQAMWLWHSITGHYATLRVVQSTEQLKHRRLTTPTLSYQRIALAPFQGHENIPNTRMRRQHVPFIVTKCEGCYLYRLPIIWQCSAHALLHKGVIVSLDVVDTFHPRTLGEKVPVFSGEPKEGFGN